MEEEWQSRLGLKEFLDVHTVRHYSKYTTRPKQLGLDRAWCASLARAVLFFANRQRWSASPRTWAAACLASVAHVMAVIQWYYATQCTTLTWWHRPKLVACQGSMQRWAAAWRQEDSTSVALPIFSYLALCAAYAFVASSSERPSVAQALEDVEEDEDEEDDEDGSASPATSTWQSAGLGPVRVAVWDSNERRKVTMTLTELRLALSSAASADEAAEAWTGELFAIGAASLFALVRVGHGVASQRSVRWLGLTSSACSWLCAYLALGSLNYAERCYRTRLRYAKLYAATTSSRRARSRGVPYLSLRKVENLKVWLALRAGRGYLDSFMRERQADAVCSTAFHACAGFTVALLALYFRAAAGTRGRRFPHAAFHFELLLAFVATSSYVVAFVGLGSRVNARYSDATTLHVEMINIQLRLQRLADLTQHPRNNGRSVPPPVDTRPDRLAKKARLQSSLAVLKLATKLLKDLDSPSKVSGFAMDPLFYNVVRCVFYSALSAALSEWFGLDLKFKPSYFK